MMNYFWDENSIPILQLGPDFYDEATPATFPTEILRFWNRNVPIDFDKRSVWHFKALSHNLTRPLALKYHGHQFQHYNPQLGDGRGFLFAQMKINNQWFDLGTKGSGQTTYSRSGDGKLTLKGALREALATEMLESYGVNTSKTLCFFETGEKLQRGDEPSPTRSAVLTRFSLGHIRIGTFQRLAYFNETNNIKKLISYCLSFYFQEELCLIKNDNELSQAQSFLKFVCTRQAKLAAEIMMAGFVHGVLNTDNINISGELFDYGPYRFLPTYDPSFTAAYFDQSGLYAFGRQPHSLLWNLQQLGLSLQAAFPDLELNSLVENFNHDFSMAMQKQFLHRLNLKCSDADLTLRTLSIFFQLLEEKKLPFEQVFFDFFGFNLYRINKSKFIKDYTGVHFEKLKENFSLMSIANENLNQHAYFVRANPETLLIDEIESIWKHIADSDDWTLFENKIQSIRSLRGIY